MLYNTNKCSRDGGHRGGGVGVQPPAKDQGILLVAAHSNVGVADIDGEDHGQGSFRSAL